MSSGRDCLKIIYMVFYMMKNDILHFYDPPPDEKPVSIYYE